LECFERPAVSRVDQAEEPTPSRYVYLKCPLEKYLKHDLRLQAGGTQQFGALFGLV